MSPSLLSERPAVAEEGTVPLSQRLRREVWGDLRPVRPLPRPALRTLEVAVWAVALLLVVPALLPLRGDAATLGWPLLWGAAAAEVLAGLTLVALALREAVPGSGIGRPQASLALAAGAALQLTIAMATWLHDTPITGAEAARHGGLACFSAQELLALPGLALAVWLVVRALPVRPRVAGALAGMGAGLVADGVWHLICPRSDPAHVLVWHGGATALMAGFGWLLGALYEARAVRAQKRALGAFEA